jgi:hypothetical protein
MQSMAIIQKVPRAKPRRGAPALNNEKSLAITARLFSLDRRRRAGCAGAQMGS